MMIQFKIYPEHEPERVSYAYNYLVAAFVEWRVGMWTWLRGKPQRVCVEVAVAVPK